MQVYGMLGVARSSFQLRKWVQRLVSAPIERFTELGPPKFAMVVPATVDASLGHHGTAGRLPVVR